MYLVPFGTAAYLRLFCVSDFSFLGWPTGRGHSRRPSVRSSLLKNESLASGRPVCVLRRSAARVSLSSASVSISFQLIPGTRSFQASRCNRSQPRSRLSREGWNPGSPTIQPLTPSTSLPISLDSRLRGKDGRAGSGRERLLPDRVVNAPGPARRCAPPRSTTGTSTAPASSWPGSGCVRRIASRSPHTDRPLDTSGTAPATGARYAHSFKGSNTARHSREGGNPVRGKTDNRLVQVERARHSRDGGNPVRGLRRNVFLLDSRLRGNDAIRGSLHKLCV